MNHVVMDHHVFICVQILEDCFFRFRAQCYQIVLEVGHNPLTLQDFIERIRVLLYGEDRSRCAAKYHL